MRDLDDEWRERLSPRAPVLIFAAHPDTLSTGGMARSLDDLFAALARSEFRSPFRLRGPELERWLRAQEASDA